MTDRLSDAELAARIAVGAGEVLSGIRHGDLIGGRLLGDVGDALAQAWISTVLRTHRPHDAVLSEEAADVGDRSTASRVWIIDPLDGTSEFSMGTADWAVHVALAVDGLPEVAAVSLPAHGELFRSDDVPLADGPLTGRLAVSRYGHSYHSAAVADRLGMDAIRIGSAGAKAMAVVRGDADAYVHSGGQYEWDNCAPVGVALAAGLHCSRLDGRPIVYNNPQPYMPDFIICRTEIADDVLDAVSTPW
ncbi:3'(2'),5'-bisphosphate nucleotidase [Gordonia malaquae]|uniref:3'(2'),5-bisphosphonucleoside 3'(2')-phosphohydrolase n=1 Tax=Gordonia malaquae NBRC 108250 TaxID=1223542 RepID=M3VBG2_GORML|nr:3'(2'),5'-bisphosphate nucleotidase CysQ [Gordonia malaquae]GAC80208.1 putative phosphatase [Gordonia malaquae NBRC 108250]SEB92681.1 3'(2'),5'-bisphosphate nucleotidase [Gordonia malaquae]